jgi:hypothetical protein
MWTSGLSTIPPSPLPIHAIVDRLPADSWLGTVLQAVGIALQVILAVGAIWLARETWRLRKQGESQLAATKRQLDQTDNQLKLLETQTRLSVFPPLIIQAFSRNIYTVHIQQMTDLVAEQEKWMNVLNRYGQNAPYVLWVDNPSERFALNLMAILYHAQTGMCYVCPDTRESLGKFGVPFFFRMAPISLDDTKEFVEKQYPMEAKWACRQLQPKDGAAFGCLFYRDIEDRLYVRKRRTVDLEKAVSASGELYFHGA